MGDWEWAKKGGGAAHYDQEDDPHPSAPDGNATYNETQNIDAVQRTQTFGFQGASQMGIGASDSILAVGLSVVADAPNGAIRADETILIEDNGTEDGLRFQAEQGPWSTVAFHTGPNWGRRPSNGNQWTVSAVDGVRGKLRRIAVAKNMRSTVRTLGVYYGRA